MWAKICLVFLIVSANACLACSCIPAQIQPPAEGAPRPTKKQVVAQEAAWYLGKASLVVRAKVLGTNHKLTEFDQPKHKDKNIVRATIIPASDNWIREYQISVIEVLKGTLELGTTVIRADTGPCGLVELVPDDEWIFFVGAEPLSQCSGHARLNSAFGEGERHRQRGQDMLAALRSARGLELREPKRLSDMLLLPPPPIEITK